MGKVVRFKLTEEQQAKREREIRKMCLGVNGRGQREGYPTLTGGYRKPLRRMDNY